MRRRRLHTKYTSDKHTSGYRSCDESWKVELNRLLRKRNESHRDLVRHLTHGQKRKIFRTLRSHLAQSSSDDAVLAPSSTHTQSNHHARSCSTSRCVDNQYASRHVIVCRVHKTKGLMYTDAAFEENRKPRVEGRGWDPESETCKIAAIPVSDFSVWYVAQGISV